MPWLMTVAAALIGAGAFEVLRVPAGAVIGAMVGVALMNVLGASPQPLSRPLEFLALAAVGWLIGQGITLDVLRSLAIHAGLIALTVAALVAFSAALAFTLVKIGHVDPATAFLATSPGGLSQMAALSAAVGADGALVSTLHVVRVISVVAVAPLVLRILPASTG